MNLPIENIVSGAILLQKKRQSPETTLPLPAQRILCQWQKKQKIDLSLETKNDYYPPLYRRFVSLLMVNGDRSKASTMLAKALVDYRQALLKGRRMVPIIPASSSPIGKKGVPLKGGERSRESENETSPSSRKQSLLLGGGTLGLLMEAINNVKPSLEVRRVRIAATTYTVPAVIQKGRQDTLAIRWLLEGAKRRRKRGSLSFSQSLTQELVDAFNKQGHALQKRDQLHALAESNRAYVRYRWW